MGKKAEGRKLKSIDSNNKLLPEKVSEQIVQLISDRKLKAGEKLPTVRDLAAEAGVNPSTMQRALAALDGEGLSIPNRTIGRTVTEDEGVLEAMRSRLAGNIIDQFFEATAELGYSKEQAVQLLERSMKE